MRKGKRKGEEKRREEERKGEERARMGGKNALE